MFINSATLIGSNDLDNPSSFSDSNISFKYPGNWKNNYNTDAYLVLTGNGIVFDIFYNSLKGRSLDDVTEGLISELNDSSKTLLFRNTTTIDSLKAYDITFKANDNGHVYYFRMLIFASNNNYYVFTFTVKNLEDIGPEFDLIKNSTTIKN